jgi:outer membrane protein assembly factor BamB
MRATKRTDCGPVTVLRRHKLSAAPTVGALATLAVVVGCLGPRALENNPLAELSATALVGIWEGRPSHNGETSRIFLHLEANPQGQLQVKMSTPALHVWEYPLGPVTIQPGGIRIQSLAMTLVYDRVAGTLTGTLPIVLVPVYSMLVTFHRTRPFGPRPRPESSAMVAAPVWVFDAAAPIWADTAFANGIVIVGADDGRLHALEGRTGREVWAFRAGGAIRARPAISGRDVFIQADDGFLYRLDAVTGEQRWRVRVAATPIERVQIGDQNSRYDNRASAVTLTDGTLYVGTHDGHLLAIDSARGSQLWDFAANDTVSTTPLVVAGKVYFGSFDGKVYALDATSGSSIWRYETGAPVTSSPAKYQDQVIIGSRSYDLLALDGASGKRVWTKYYWFSWVESPATIRGGLAYIGSSDAAKVFALDARSGRKVWEVDVGGSAWAQPAVSESRVYIGTVGVLNYLVPHHATVLALDRKTGRPAWRHPVAPPAIVKSETIPYGFAGSPSLGDGFVYFPSLDGHVYAFAE